MFSASVASGLGQMISQGFCRFITAIRIISHSIAGLLMKNIIVLNTPVT